MPNYVCPARACLWNPHLIDVGRSAQNNLIPVDPQNHESVTQPLTYKPRALQFYNALPKLATAGVLHLIGISSPNAAPSTSGKLGKLEPSEKLTGQ